MFPVEVPPLRERREDIPLLTWTFVKEFWNSMGKAIDAIADELMAALQAYPWPGNIRELRNVIERAMILTRGSTLHIKLGHPALRPQTANAAGTLEEAEREHILRALERCGWRIRGSNAAAELLGIKPTTLESRIKKLGLCSGTSLPNSVKIPDIQGEPATCTCTGVTRPVVNQRWCTVPGIHRTTGMSRAKDSRYSTPLLPHSFDPLLNIGRSYRLFR